MTLENAADDLKSIRFPSGCGDSAIGAAQCQLSLDEGIIHRDTRRNTVQNGANRRSVAFAEYGYCQGLAKSVLHSPALPFATMAMASRKVSGAADSIRQLPTLSTFATLIRPDAAFLSCSIA